MKKAISFRLVDISILNQKFLQPRSSFPSTPDLSSAVTTASRAESRSRVPAPANLHKTAQQMADNHRAGEEVSVRRIVWFSLHTSLLLIEIPICFSILCPFPNTAARLPSRYNKDVTKKNLYVILPQRYGT